MSVGRRVRDLDWDAKTSGRAAYTADLPGGTAYAAIVRSPYPSARIVSVDTAPALALPGVLAAVTGADLPAGVRYIHHGGDLADRPPFATDLVSYLGQEVAAVAATTPEAARAAAAAVRVVYRRRRAPTRLADAVRPGAARVRPDRPAARNVSLRTSREWGDLAAARAAATVVAGGTFHTPPVAHACMEPNTTRARWSGGVLEIWTSTQAPHFIQKEVAHALGLNPAAVVCREVFVGGGFGSKSKISEHEVAVAALARALPGSTVEIRLDRAEEFAFTKTRHAFASTLRVGADADGRIRLLEGRFAVDNGAFNHSGPSVMGAGAGTLGELYRPDGVRYDAELVYTAKQPGGQFRGYGTPQVAFATESLVDEVAERLGLDPLELRIRNANAPDTVTLSGLRLQSARLVECLQAVRDELKWDERRDALPDGHGLGVAVAVHASGAFAYDGANRSSARVGIDAEGAVRVDFGGADAGTGQKTVIAQVAAQELDCPLARVHVSMMDSETTPFDMGAWSSRGTYFSAHAVRAAARRLRATLVAAGPRPLAEAVRDHPDTRDGFLAVEETYVEHRMERVGGPGPHNKSGTYGFAAHGVEVAVDRRTGEVRVVDYVAAHDVGRAINPTMIEGQIHGGVAMGLGAALGERVIHERGRVVNPSYLSYGLLRAPDLPRVRTVLVEGPDAAGPYSAKGIGEITVVPCGPAVANAIYHAVGVRLRELPLTPDRVLAALRGEEALSRRVDLRRRPSRWWVSAMRRAYPLGVDAVLHRYGTRLARPATPSRIEAIDRPSTLADARAALDRSTAVALGGGTDLIPDGVRSRHDGVHLVSLTRIAPLRTVGRTESGALRLGGAVTLAEVETSAVVPEVLRQAAAGIAGPQIRAAATVAGNLLQEKRCWFYRNGFDCYKRGGPTCPCYAVTGDHSKYHAALGAHRCQAVTPSDLATALVALDASVTVLRAGGRVEEVPVAALYTGPGETVVRRGDLVAAVTVPAASLARRGAFAKIGGWSGDFAMVSTAVVADVAPDGALLRPTVVVGAVAPIPWVAPRSPARVDPADLPGLVAADLVAVAHPLPGNGWKLDAAVGLVARVASLVARDGHDSGPPFG